MYRFSLLHFIPALLLSAPAALRAGSFSQNFDSLADNAPLGTAVNTHVNLVGATDAQGRVISNRKETNNTGTYIVSVVKPGIGTVPSKALRLAEKGTGSAASAYHLPQLDPAADLQEITLTLDLLMGPPASGLPADAFSISFGKNLSNVGGAGGHTTAFGFVVNFDTFSNTSATVNDPRSIEVFSDGTSAGNFLATGLPGGNFTLDQQWRRVELHWDANGLDLTYAGQVIYNDLPLPGFSPLAGSAFAFNSTTGGSTQDTYLDNVVVATVPKAAPPPIVTTDVTISELLADNASGLEDEELSQPDWFEFYNGTAAPVTMTDWCVERTSVDPLVPVVRWKMPALTIPAGGYQTIFASGKNKFTNVRPHTNFTIDKAGGSLRLFKADGVTVADVLAFGPQKEDVSFGKLDAAQTIGHLGTQTPGARNSGPQAANPPPDVPVFDQPSRVLLTGATVNLGMSLPVGAPVGSEIRYTLNNTEVLATSPLYTAPISISSGTTVRARVFAPGHLPSKQGSRSFILLANGAMTDNLADNYNASGQAFSSNLPVLVFDSFGKNVDGLTDPLGLRPYRFTQMAVYDLNPATGRASLAAAPNLVTRGGTHVRGQSSAGQAERPYAVEFWKDNEDTDEDHPLLGMPSHSDWVLMTLTMDKSLMRNYLMQQMMLEMNGPGTGVRCRFVEVFFNQNNTVTDYADYRGVYLLMEKISRGRERVNIAKLNDSMSDPALISGGYIIKNDKTPYEASFTPTGNANVPGSSRIYDTFDPEPPTTNQVTAIRNYMSSLASALGAADWNQPASANYYQKWLDERSFIDKTLWYEVCKEVDAYVFSNYFSKDRNDVLKAFPFWDVDRSLGNSNYGSSNSAYGWKWWYVGTNYTYYSRLDQDAEYQDRYWNRYTSLRRGVFSRQSLENRIEAAYTLLNDGNATPVTNTSAPTIQNPVARHYRKYPNLGSQTFAGGQTGQASRTTYRQEVDNMKLWLWDRLAWLDGQAPLGMVEIRRASDNVPQYGGNVSLGFQYKLQNPGLTGDIYYTVNGPDPRETGGGLVAAATLLADDGGLATSPLFASGQTWKWLLPAAAPTATWFTEGFNDTTWGSGAAPLGYEQPAVVGELATNISPTLPAFTAATTEPNPAYFRTTFNLASVPALTGARFEIMADDGAVVYLNGQEVARINFPYAPTTAAFTQEANGPLDPSGTKADAERLYYPVEFDHTKLKVGVNTIAVEVHQAVYSFPPSPLSNATDMRFDLRIVGLNQGTTSTLQTLTTAGAQTVRARIKDGGTWGPLTEAVFVVDGAPASAANLVVSELHYHPLPPTPAELAAGFNKDNDFEFVELMNIGPVAIDLSSVRLTGAVEFNFDTALPAARFLPPGGRVVVVENLAAFQSRLAVGANPVIAGAFAGNFGDGGELFTILGAGNAAIKSFTYDDDEPWPEAADGSGYSLVLNAPMRNPDHSVAGSWQPSAVLGGQPGTSDHVPFTGAPADWNNDSDGDGLTDGVEFAMGANALPSTEPAVIAPDGDEYLLLYFSRNLSAGEVNYLPELSTDLANWNAAAFTYHATTHNDNGTATVTYRSVQPTSALPPRAFFHVRVERP